MKKDYENYNIIEFAFQGEGGGEEEDKSYSFYKPFLVKMMRGIIGPYVHVETILCDEEKQYSYGIRRESRVHRKLRKYLRPNCVFYKMKVTSTQYKQYKQYLISAYQNKIEFNYIGFYWNYTIAHYFNCLGYDSRGRTFLCAELIARALVFAKIAQKEDFRRLWAPTPEEIKKFIVNKGAFITNHPRSFSNQYNV